MGFGDNIEVKESIRLLALASYDEDKLGFKVNSANGEIMDSEGKQIASKKIAGELVRKANTAGINYIFIGDTNHTETEKDKLFSGKDLFNEAQKAGYSAGFENNQTLFKAGFGVEYSKDVNLNTLFENRNNFIDVYQKLAVNKEKSFEQGNVVYTRMYHAIDNNVPVIFNEPLTDDLTATNRFKELFGQDGLCDKKLKEKYTGDKYTNLHNTLDDIGEQLSYPERDKTCAATLEGKRSIVFRGALHQMFSNDLNETLTPSITVINCTDANDVIEHIKFAQSDLDARNKAYAILNALAKEFPEYAEDIKNFKKELKGQQRGMFDVPDYIVCEGKLYDGETYLKTHKIRENGLSLYDHLVTNNMITTNDYTPATPEKQQPATPAAPEKGRSGGR